MHSITLRHLLRNFAGRIALVGGIGWCTLAHAVKPEILSPTPGSVVTTPVAVEVKYGGVQYCDTDGCTEVPAESLDLFDDVSTDGVLVGSCATKTECPDGMADFELELTPGSHVLRAVVSDNVFSAEASEKVEFTVEPAPVVTTGDASSTGDADTGDTDATGDTDTTGDAATTSTTDPGDSGGEGCGCTSAGGASGGLMWLAAVVLVPRRRRRHCGVSQLAQL